jgi:hypothetical protein
VGLTPRPTDVVWSELRIPNASRKGGRGWNRPVAADVDMGVNRHVVGYDGPAQLRACGWAVVIPFLEDWS